MVKSYQRLLGAACWPSRFRSPFTGVGVPPTTITSTKSRVFLGHFPDCYRGIEAFGTSVFF